MPRSAGVSVYAANAQTERFSMNVRVHASAPTKFTAIILVSSTLKHAAVSVLAAAIAKHHLSTATDTASVYAQSGEAVQAKKFSATASVGVFAESEKTVPVHKSLTLRLANVSVLP